MSWTFLDVLVLKPLKGPIFIKIDLETVFRPYDSYVRLYNTSWIFNVLHLLRRKNLSRKVFLNTSQVTDQPLKGLLSLHCT